MSDDLHDLCSYLSLNNDKQTLISYKLRRGMDCTNVVPRASFETVFIIFLYFFRLCSYRGKKWIS